MKGLCEIIVVTGYTAGPRWNEAGSGSNYLCLPEHPQWRNYSSGNQSSGSIMGVEYDSNSIFSTRNNRYYSLGQKPAPCALCYVFSRSTVAMVPARTQCPDGWTTEYGGYLVSTATHGTNRKRSSYICLDEAPEVANGTTGINRALIFPVEVTCGSLPCSVYISGRELTCVVCSK